MALTLIAYPKIIFVQSAEPDNKAEGLLWYDIDDGKLYASNGTNYIFIGTEPSLIAGDTELIANNTERTKTDPVAYILIKEILITNIPETSSLRATFEIKSNVTARAVSALFYVNGVSLGGTVHTSTTNETYSAKTEDLSNLQMGSHLQIYCKYDTLATDCLIKNFKLKGEATPNESILGAFFDLSAN